MPCQLYCPPSPCRPHPLPALLRCLQVQAGATRRLMSVHSLGSPRTLLSYGSYGAYSVGWVWGQVLASRWLQVGLGDSACVCAYVCTALPPHSMAARTQASTSSPKPGMATASAPC